MAVTLSGYTQAVFWSKGKGTVAWPVGTVAGDIAVLAIAGTGSTKRKPDTSGWTLRNHTYSTDVYYKVIEASDIAAALPVTGYIAFLSTYSGAESVTSGTSKPGANITAAGNGLFVFGRKTSALSPATDKLGTDVINKAYNNRYTNCWFTVPTKTGYCEIVGCNASSVNGFEIVAAQGTGEPIILTPQNGAAINRSLGAYLSWQHVSGVGEQQSARQIRFKDVTDVDWSGVDSSGNVGEQVQVSTSDTFVTVHNSYLTSGHTYEWQVRTWGFTGEWGPWSPVSSFYAGTPPSLSTVAVTSPAGTLTPLIEWTPAGAFQQIAWHTRITSSTAASAGDSIVWDSGVHADDDEDVTAPATEWTNGAGLKAWVRVKSDDGLWSAWKASDPFTVSWTPPGAPTAVTAVAGTPTVVTVTGVTGRDLVEVHRSTDAGITWDTVGTVDPSGASVTVSDPTGMYGDNVLYRARAADITSGVTLWSDWTTMAAPVVNTDKSAYLFAVDNPADYLKVEVHQDPITYMIRGVSVSYPIGADRPVVVRTPNAGRAGTLTLNTVTKASRDALLAWLEGHPVFVFRPNPERDWDGTWKAIPTIRMAPSSPIDLMRVDHSPTAERDIVLDWVEQ